MVKFILAILVVAIAAGAVYAEEKKLGKDDFVSSTISDVVDKVEKVTSGEEKIFMDEYDNNGHEQIKPNEDPLGRKVPDPLAKPIRKP